MIEVNTLNCTSCLECGLDLSECRCPQPEPKEADTQTETLVDWDKYWNEFVRSDLSAEFKARQSIHSLRKIGQFFEAKIVRLMELNDKYKWQVRDTCTRAEKAETELTRLQAELDEAGGLIGKMADSLEDEFKAAHPEATRKAYPSSERRYQRDMSEAYEARAFITKHREKS